MHKRCFCVASALFALIGAWTAPACAKASAATVSQGECVIEESSRRFLHLKNADSPLPMASTTKILTAIIIIDDCALSEKITVPEDAAGREGSSVYLRAGDVYTAEELLYGLMLRSGNDCAETLAIYHSGSVEAFAETMNKKAASLGCEHSFFVNPHGLPDERHHTTARDLSLIAAYCMQNETFRRIVSCQYYEPRGWKNKNKMLVRYEGANGIKTGYTLRAGRCLVTSASRNGMTLICTVLNSPQMYERTAELLDTAFSAYSLVTLCESGAYGGFRIDYAFSYPLTASEREQIVCRTETLSPLPEKRGEFAGRMKILLENNLLFSQNLYIM